MRRCGSLLQPMEISITSNASRLIGGTLTFIYDILCDVTVDRRTVLQTGLAMASTRGRTAPRTYLLQVLGHVAASHKQIAIGARPLTVGAHASCDLVLDDPKVS